MARELLVYIDVQRIIKKVLRSMLILRDVSLFVGLFFIVSCSGQAGVPNSTGLNPIPIEIPTKSFQIPQNIAISISELNNRGEVPFASVASIVEDHNIQVSTLLSIFAGVEIPADKTRSDYDATVNGSQLHFDFSDYNFGDYSDQNLLTVDCSQTCSGNSKVLPVCVRVWVDGHRYLAAKLFLVGSEPAGCMRINGAEVMNEQFVDTAALTGAETYKGGWAFDFRENEEQFEAFFSTSGDGEKLFPGGHVVTQETDLVFNNSVFDFTVDGESAHTEFIAAFRRDSDCMRTSVVLNGAAGDAFFEDVFASKSTAAELHENCDDGLPSAALSQLVRLPEPSDYTLPMENLPGYVSTAKGSPGTLNQSFGNGGVFSKSIILGDDSALAMAVLDDGSILLAGSTNSSTIFERRSGANLSAKAAPGGGVFDPLDNDLAVMKILANGQLDLTFGVDGLALIDVGSIGDSVYGILVQNSGDIVLIGETTTQTFLLRISENGRVDTSFGHTGSGIVLLDAAGGSAGRALTLDDQDRIVAVGKSEQSVHLMRFTANGLIDATFGNDGEVITSFDQNSIANSVSIDRSGRIVVGGFITSADGGTTPGSAIVIRYLASGLLDENFGDSGMANLGVSMDSGVKDLLINTSGDIFAVGGVWNGLDDDWGVWKISETGILVNSFGSSGLVQRAGGIGLGDLALTVREQTDGKILVAGYVRSGFNSNGDRSAAPHMELIRYNSNGAMDITFGEEGVFSSTLAETDAGSLIHSISVFSEDKILIGAQVDGGMSLLSIWQ